MVFVRDFKKEFYDVVQHQVCYTIRKLHYSTTTVSRRTVLGYYTVSQKKTAPFFSSITLSNVHGF